MQLARFFTENEAGLVWWAIVLTGIMYLGYFISALTSKTTISGRKWFSVWSLFTCFWSLLSSWLFFNHLDALGSVVGRLAQFVGAPHELVVLHARAFMAIVVIVAVRGYFVISEMDNGRYAGSEALPKVLASRSLGTRFLEATVRLGIIAGLTIFISLFLRIVIPTNGHDWSIAGAPLVLEDIHRDCAETAARLAVIHHGYDVRGCVYDEIATLPLRPEDAESDLSLVEIAENLMAPMQWLWVIYVGMVAWCIVMWIGCLGRNGSDFDETDADKNDRVRNRYRRALFLQILIAGAAGLNLVLMQRWIDVSTTRSFDLMPHGGDVSGVLLVVSNGGIIISAAVLIFLSFRLIADFTTAYLLYERARGVAR